MSLKKLHIVSIFLLSAICMVTSISCSASDAIEPAEPALPLAASPATPASPATVIQTTAKLPLPPAAPSPAEAPLPAVITNSESVTKAKKETALIELPLANSITIAMSEQWCLTA